MFRALILTAAAAGSLGAVPAAAQVAKASPAPTPAAAVRPAPQTLTAQQDQQLQAMIAQHERVRAKLSPSDRADLDQLTAHVRKQLFASPRRGTLLSETSGIVSKAIPGLSSAEASAFAEYTLGGIATPSGGTSGGSAIGSASGGDGSSQLMNATQQMQETQMSFNLQYLQLQSQMQNENRSYTAVSNIMKTKHDTVKNSISNIR
jgi:hypothetical protein